MHARLSTLGSIGHRDRSRCIAAQEASQADEPQEAEEAPVVEVIVIPGLWARRGRHLHGRPRRRRLLAPRASATEEGTTATRAARRNTIVHTVRLQHEIVMGLRSLHMVYT